MCRFRAAIVVLILFAPVPWTASGASLDGTWEACFQEADSPPGPDAEWKSIRVPSLVGRVDGKPFLWYRRSFEAPAKDARERLFLRIGASRFVTTVLVNGTEVGSHYGGWEPFEVDITRVCRIGRPNQLVVRAQDVTGVIDQPMGRKKLPRGERYIAEARDTVMMPVGSQYTTLGIWEPVSLIARRDVYVEHVFVRTSVRKKQIEADITSGLFLANLPRKKPDRTSTPLL